MRVDRRRVLTGMMAAAGAANLGHRDAHAKTEAKASEPPKPSGAELNRAAARPVLRTDGFKSPVVIDSIRLLKKDGDTFVHVRSKDGAEGIALTNPPRESYLDKILKQLVIPFF